ncbi:Ferredoxin-1 [Porphyridium purpureum]|uniref:Ferredoxin-1 n=1 Tax=Porphyridium purpureum TaxID=35688 RepID=A0A5J4Z9X2_PORPP|nr:Ferredoxin-1 [Porphyridium purpureum]|eukprot:POR0052..scf295_1
MAWIAQPSSGWLAPPARKGGGLRTRSSLVCWSAHAHDGARALVAARGSNVTTPTMHSASGQMQRLQRSDRGLSSCGHVFRRRRAECLNASGADQTASDADSQQHSGQNELQRLRSEDDAQVPDTSSMTASDSDDELVTRSAQEKSPSPKTASSTNASDSEFAAESQPGEASSVDTGLVTRSRRKTKQTGLGNGKTSSGNSEASSSTNGSQAASKPGKRDGLEQFFEFLQSDHSTRSLSRNALGAEPSHKYVKFDANGVASRDRFVYVDEVDCIGCSHCAMTARNTFFLEPDHGRARAFRQDGDPEELVSEAIDTCPVNCIYYVDWDDLVTLEKERVGQRINNAARLVGGSDLTNARAQSKASVMTSGKVRCENCPGRGCADCPLYGVGENPEYMRKKETREAKRRARAQQQTNRERRLEL